VAEGQEPTTEQDFCKGLASDAATTKRNADTTGKTMTDKGISRKQAVSKIKYQTGANRMKGTRR